MTVWVVVQELASHATGYVEHFIAVHATEEGASADCSWRNEHGLFTFKNRTYSRSSVEHPGEFSYSEVEVLK